MVTEEHAAGALDGSVDPEELTTLLAQENQELRAEIERLKAQLEMAKKHGEVLQDIGRALSLPPGADLHRDCVPAIYELFQSIGRTTLQSDGQAREVLAIVSQLKAENAELRQDKARLDRGYIMTGVPGVNACEHRGLDLRAAIDRVTQLDEQRAQRQAMTKEQQA